MRNRLKERRPAGPPRGAVPRRVSSLEAGATTGVLWRDTCRSLTAPVYHLCRDPAQADRMRPWFSHPKSKVDVCPNAGHWIMQDRKDDVNAAATAWIDAL
jgi:pimeloyl-ACP methyl ester carboxylesterase